MIVKYNDFLSEDLLILIDNKIKDIFNQKTERAIFSSSISHWSEYLKSSSTPILRYVMDASDTNLVSSLKKEIEKKIPYYVDDIIIHIFPKLSYIPWHNDGGHKAALTIYINELWEANWGGFFMYKIDENIFAIKPERNLAILQNSGLPHCVTTTNIDADFRISIQCFIKQEKKLL
jgi:Rps23 Pro-64 3,4-dihydroxylase Tpa1-like proline 4-hydroxylase